MAVDQFFCWHTISLAIDNRTKKNPEKSINKTITTFPMKIDAFVGSSEERGTYNVRTKMDRKAKKQKVSFAEVEEENVVVLTN